VVRSLVHFSLGLKEYGAIFGVMVGLTAVEHIVWRSECVWASTVATVWCTASLIVLSESLIRGHWVSFWRRWPKILLPVLWGPVTIKVNAMHWLGIVVLVVIIVRGPLGFIWF
jgi:hypothetical protein